MPGDLRAGGFSMGAFVLAGLAEIVRQISNASKKAGEREQLKGDEGHLRVPVKRRVRESSLNAVSNESDPALFAPRFRRLAVGRAANFHEGGLGEARRRSSGMGYHAEWEF